MTTLKRFASACKRAKWLVWGGSPASPRGETPAPPSLQEHLSQIEARLAGLHNQLQGVLTQAQFLSAAAKVDVLGHTMYLDPTDDGVCPSLLRDGCYEAFETALVSREIKAGDLVVDIGANIGYFTLLFARLVGETGKVIAFEPDPANFRLLQKNVRANGYRNVVLIPKGVSNVTGTLDLYVCGSNKGDHRLYDSKDGRNSIKVQTTTLDDALASETRHVDFIKMDIQGSEPGAVQGMHATVRKSPRLKMITEFWPFGLERFGVAAEHYLKQLTELGFRLWNVDDQAEKLTPMSTAEMLATYLPEKQNYTNLFCLRETTPQN